MLAQQLRSLLDSVSFAADTGSFRFTTQSIQLECNGKITACATDGRHMAYREMPESFLPDGQYLLDVRGVRDLCRRITKTAFGQVAWSPKGDKAITFQVTRKAKPRVVTCEVPLVEGRFPNWKECYHHDTVTGQPEGVIHGVREDVLGSLPTPGNNGYLFDLRNKTASIVQDIKPPKNSGCITIAGEASMRLDVEALRNWLESLPAKSKLTIEFYDDGRPVRGNADNGSHYLLMPMRRKCDLC